MKHRIKTSQFVTRKLANRQDIVTQAVKNRITKGDYVQTEVQQQSPRAIVPSTVAKMRHATETSNYETGEYSSTNLSYGQARFVNESAFLPPGVLNSHNISNSFNLGRLSPKSGMYEPLRIITPPKVCALRSSTRQGRRSSIKKCACEHTENSARKFWTSEHKVDSPRRTSHHIPTNSSNSKQRVFFKWRQPSNIHQVNTSALAS